MLHTLTGLRRSLTNKHSNNNSLKQCSFPPKLGTDSTLRQKLPWSSVRSDPGHQLPIHYDNLAQIRQGSRRVLHGNAQLVMGHSMEYHYTGTFVSHQIEVAFREDDGIMYTLSANHRITFTTSTNHNRIQGRDKNSPSAEGISGRGVGPFSSQNCSNSTWAPPGGIAGARSNTCTHNAIATFSHNKRAMYAVLTIMQPLCFTLVLCRFKSQTHSRQHVY